MENKKVYCPYWADCKDMAFCDLVLTEKVISELQKDFSISEKQIEKFDTKPNCFIQRRYGD